jgi:hypothetical protein
MHFTAPRFSSSVSGTGALTTGTVLNGSGADVGTSDGVGAVSTTAVSATNLGAAA